MAHSPDAVGERLAEAASYALLRRMAPALRHDMAGALQPVSMMTAMLEKRLQKPGPDMAVLVKNASAISTLSREAAASCMSLMTWLAPKEDAPVPVNVCVAESIGLVNTELSFRGISLVNETGDADGLVLLSRIRGVFMASLLALTDACDTPASIVLTVDVTDEALVLLISLSPAAGEPMSTGAAPAYRKLQWEDVEALAHAQHVGLTHTCSSVALSFPA